MNSPGTSEPAPGSEAALRRGPPPASRERERVPGRRVPSPRPAPTRRPRPRSAPRGSGGGRRRVWVPGCAAAASTIDGGGAACVPLGWQGPPLPGPQRVPVRREKCPGATGLPQVGWWASPPPAGAVPLFGVWGCREVTSWGGGCAPRPLTGGTWQGLHAPRECPCAPGRVASNRK